MTSIPNDVVEQHRLVACGQLVLCLDEITLQPYLYDPITKIRVPTTTDFDDYQGMIYKANWYYRMRQIAWV